MPAEGHFDSGGQTTRRRPNNLESSEYAPGPSSDSAQAWTASSAQNAGSALRSGQMQASASTPARGAINGVSRPRQMRMPAAKRIASGVSTTRKSATASAQRSSNSAAPGAPAGNVVNSFCTRMDGILRSSAVVAATQWAVDPSIEGVRGVMCSLVKTAPLGTLP